MRSLKSCWERERETEVRIRGIQTPAFSSVPLPTSVFQQSAGYGGPVAYCLGTECERLSPQMSSSLWWFIASVLRAAPMSPLCCREQQRPGGAEDLISPFHTTCQLRSRKMALFQAKFELPRVFTSILRKLSTIFLQSSEDEMRSCT